MLFYKITHKQRLSSEGYCELIDDNDEDSGDMGGAKLRQIRVYRDVVYRDRETLLARKGMMP